MAARSPAIGRLLCSSRPTIQAKTSHQVRYASQAAARPSNKARNFLYGTGALLLVTGGYLYVTDTRASIHRYVVPRLIRVLFPDAEDAHHFGTAALKELYTLGLHPRERGSAEQNSHLSVEVFGTTLPNPIGISGGLDKGGVIADALFATGPSIVEIGGITPLPQIGNDKPRVFRLASQNALINRYGLNSEGADAVARRLRERVREYAYAHGFGLDELAEDIVLNGAAGVPPGSLVPGRLLAVQIAKNKLTPDNDLDAVVRDHVVCVEKLGKYADIITVNVSSPNTPGLRALQSKGPLTSILSAVVETANAVDRKIKPVVMVKVSPDEDSPEQVQGIVDAVWESGVAGVIVGNTTMKRPDPLPLGYTLPAKDLQAVTEMGGYSGPQLFERTKVLVAKYRKALDAGPSADVALPEKPADKILPQLSDESKSANEKVVEQVVASANRDQANLKPLSPSDVSTPRSEPSGENLPLIRVPERHSEPSSTSSTNSSLLSAITSQSANPAASLVGKGKALSSPSKVIFASGGITNGEQALEVLNAGASVAMCYTGVVYGGVGTISRIKDEMREKIGAEASKLDGKSTPFDTLRK